MGQNVGICRVSRCIHVSPLLPCLAETWTSLQKDLLSQNRALFRIKRVAKSQLWPPWLVDGKRVRCHPNRRVQQRIARSLSGMDTRPGSDLCSTKFPSTWIAKTPSFCVWCVCVPYDFTLGNCGAVLTSRGLVPLNDLPEVEEAPRSDCRCWGQFLEMVEYGGVISSSCTHHYWKSNFFWTWEHVIPLNGTRNGSRCNGWVWFCSNGHQIGVWLALDMSLLWVLRPHVQVQPQILLLGCGGLPIREKTYTIRLQNCVHGFVAVQSDPLSKLADMKRWPCCKQPTRYWFPVMFPCVFAGSLMEPVEDYLLLRMRLSGYAGRICCCQLKTASFLVLLKCQTGSIMWWLNSGSIHKNMKNAGGSQLEQLWLRQAGIHGPKGCDGCVPWSQDWPFKKTVEAGYQMGMGQNPIPLVNIKIAGKWMFIPLKMVCIGIDPEPNSDNCRFHRLLLFHADSRNVSLIVCCSSVYGQSSLHMMDKTQLSRVWSQISSALDHSGKDQWKRQSFYQAVPPTRASQLN